MAVNQAAMRRRARIMRAVNVPMRAALTLPFATPRCDTASASCAGTSGPGVTVQPAAMSYSLLGSAHA